MDSEENHAKPTESTQAIRAPGMAQQGWNAIVEELRSVAASLLRQAPRVVIAIECNVGVNSAKILDHLRQVNWRGIVLDCRVVFKIQTIIDSLIAPWMRDHTPLQPCPLSIHEFLEADRLEAFTKNIEAGTGLIVVVGPGASCCCMPDILIYADTAIFDATRTTGLRDYTFSIANSDSGAKQILRVDMPVCDRLRRDIWKHFDYFVDATDTFHPLLITGKTLRNALATVALQPISFSPQIHQHSWKTGHGVCVPANFGYVTLPWGDTTLRLSIGHLFTAEPEKILGKALHALGKTGLPVGHILMQVVTETMVTGGGWDAKTPDGPDFITRLEIPINGPAERHTYDGLQVLVMRQGEALLELIDFSDDRIIHQSEKKAGIGVHAGEFVLIPAVVERWRISPAEETSEPPKAYAVYWNLASGAGAE